MFDITDEIRTRMTPALDILPSKAARQKASREVKLICKLLDELLAYRQARRVSQRDIHYGRARAFSEAIEIFTAISADEWLKVADTMLTEVL